MSPPQSEATGVVVEHEFALGVDELGRVCRCSRQSIVLLVEEGVLQPEPGAPEWRFGAQAVSRARRAVRLMHELELTPQGVALALDLLDRIDALQARVAELERR
jgi:chaperone modulatory protein CbpM